MAAASPLTSLLLPRLPGSSLGPAAARVSSVTPAAASLKKAALLSQCSARRFVTRAADGEGAPVDVVDASTGGEEESVDLLPSGEWTQNFSMLNYEDLQTHLEKKDHEEVVPQGPCSPIMPDERHGVVSGEWFENISLLSYEDLSSYFQQSIFKKEAKPDSVVAEVMKSEVRTAFPHNTLGEISHHFATVSGLPVVDENLVCVGMISKNDRTRAGDDSLLVKDVMTSPCIATITPSKTVLFAAIIMLKNKIHRIPVINEAGQLVGIVTRTDIFTVLEDMK